MNKILLQVQLLLIGTLFCFLDVHGQSSNGTGANSYVATRFIGWDGSNGVNPLFFRTNNVNRVRLNGTQTATFTGYTVNTAGYFGIGSGGTVPQVTNYFTTNSPLSLLHLKGRIGGFVQTNGYRPWMQTGITFTDNQDLSYMGLRQVGTDADVTETTIAWADNGGNPSAVGPDDFVFRFLGNGEGNTAISTTDFRTTSDLDGMHIGRFTSNGLIGFGNTFGVNAAGTPSLLYSRPQSLLHMSYDHQAGAGNEPFGFMQITYRRPATQTADVVGQGEAATDGLRIGIDNAVQGTGAQQHLNSVLRWQEPSSFIIQTEDNGTPNIQGNERMRVTSIGALALNWGAAYIGNQSPSQVSRIAVSHNGSSPLTRPMSLMHLGYNLGGALGEFPVQNGYRPWMDLGMLVSNSTDNVWIGLKPRSGNVTPTNNRLDAVINWGNDGDNNANAGPDLMRFIYTTEPLFGSDSSEAAKSVDGLEIARMYPGKDSTFSDGQTLYGRFGVGDFTVQGVNEQPTHKLDVVGNGRFRYLPDSLYIADNTVNKVVMVDESGVLRWSALNPASGLGSFGAACSDTVNGNLLYNTKANLNNYNFYYEGNNPVNSDNNVGFGWACGTPLKGKVDAIQYGAGGLAGNFLTFENWAEGVNSLTPTGALGLAAGNGDGSASYYGIFGQALGTNHNGNFGVYGSAPSAVNSYAGYFNGDVQAGGLFISSDLNLKQDVGTVNNALAIINQLKPHTYYMNTTDHAAFNFSETLQYGFIAQEVQQVLPSLVKQSVQPGTFDEFGNIDSDPTSYLAMNYIGLIPINTQAIIELNQKVDKASLSDQSIKTNVADLENSLDKVLAMRGVQYDWNTTVHPELPLDSNRHVGFIAQEINAIEPLLTFVDEDSFMHVSYEKVVPILVEAIEELNTTVETQDSVIASQQDQITDLNDRLTQLENCLSGILPYLCQLSQSAVETNDPAVQEQIRAQLSVKLTNNDAIILDQNVPNPFAEQTVISFSIPETVAKAQIHFYNGEGKLIQSMEIQERGLGSITVFGSDLKFGIYTYTLVADGKIVATKNMIKQ